MVDFSRLELYLLEKSVKSAVPQIKKFLSEKEINTIILTERGARVFKGMIQEIRSQLKKDISIICVSPKFFDENTGSSKKIKPSPELIKKELLRFSNEISTLVYNEGVKALVLDETISSGKSVEIVKCVLVSEGIEAPNVYTAGMEIIGINRFKKNAPLHFSRGLGISIILNLIHDDFSHLFGKKPLFKREWKSYLNKDMSSKYRFISKFFVSIAKESKDINY